MKDCELQELVREAVDLVRLRGVGRSLAVPARAADDYRLAFVRLVHQRAKWLGVQAELVFKCEAILDTEPLSAILAAVDLAVLHEDLAAFERASSAAAGDEETTE